MGLFRYAGVQVFAFLSSNFVSLFLPWLQRDKAKKGLESHLCWVRCPATARRVYESGLGVCMNHQGERERAPPSSDAEETHGISRSRTREPPVGIPSQIK